MREDAATTFCRDAVRLALYNIARVHLFVSRFGDTRMDAVFYKQLSLWSYIGLHFTADLDGGRLT